MSLPAAFGVAGRFFAADAFAGVFFGLLVVLFCSDDDLRRRLPDSFRDREREDVDPLLLALDRLRDRDRSKRSGSFSRKEI